MPTNLYRDLPINERSIHSDRAFGISIAIVAFFAALILIVATLKWSLPEPQDAGAPDSTVYLLGP